MVDEAVTASTAFEHANGQDRIVFNRNMIHSRRNIMKKIIMLALISTFAATGLAMAKSANGGQGGQGADRGGDNGPVPVIVRVRRVPTYMPRRKITEYCHIGGELSASDMECGHYSR